MIIAAVLWLGVLIFGWSIVKASRVPPQPEVKSEWRYIFRGGGCE